MSYPPFAHPIRENAHGDAWAVGTVAYKQVAVLAKGSGHGPLAQLAGARAKEVLAGHVAPRIAICQRHASRSFGEAPAQESRGHHPQERGIEGPD